MTDENNFKDDRVDDGNKSVCSSNENILLPNRSVNGSYGSVDSPKGGGLQSIRTHSQYMIEVINVFNKIENPNPIEILETSRYKAKSYKMDVLINPTKDRTLSFDIICNKKLKGVSGSEIFFSSDFLYVIKVIRPSEFGVIKRNIMKYLNYQSNNEESLLIRYYGIYSIVLDGRMHYFVLMKNIFTNFYDQIFDLKGLSVQRSNKSGILTENDFKSKNINLGNEFRVLKQIEKDASFLKELNLMDYSLIIGINPVRANDDFKFLNREDKVLLDGELQPVSIGIVDLLTEYSTHKWIEELYYSFCCMKNRSTVNAEVYYNRFMRLADVIFYNKEADVCTTIDEDMQKNNESEEESKMEHRFVENEK